ncbi:hypothetical protein HHK36_000812 [Tetracentron sinense]|uniref:FLZ-type domain-containing protein n=1 Tax=Tetracentron sinense TaxID=13715 RepID=A0A834ZWI7_TETSI|nr:hypothetical protein HHK36_000812 [Tetracentron sinense]
MNSSPFLGSFVEEDDGPASLANMESGFSGNQIVLSKNSFFNDSNRRDSYREMSRSFPSALRYARCEEHHHPGFLEVCFLCKKPLGNNRDIFMYRGDTPFCSEECRQEQIEIDEAKEKNWNLSSSMKALRKDQKKSSSNKTQKHVRTSTVAAA